MSENLERVASAALAINVTYVSALEIKSQQRAGQSAGKATKPCLQRILYSGNHLLQVSKIHKRNPSLCRV